MLFSEVFLEILASYSYSSYVKSNSGCKLRIRLENERIECPID